MPWLQGVRAFPAVLSMWSSSVKLDEEKSKCASLAQENCFGAAQLQSLPWLVKGAAMLRICTQCFWLAYHNDWPRWFAISSYPPICYPIFAASVAYWALLEMLLHIIVNEMSSHLYNGKKLFIISRIFTCLPHRHFTKPCVHVITYY